MRLRRYVSRSLAVLAAAGCGACISVPQPSEQWISGRHIGTVVDAATGKPVQGAKVRLANFPEQNAVTDATGRFTLGPVIDSRGRTRNFFTSVDAAACVDRVEVERPGYMPVSLDKGDDKKFKAACQNAIFEYQLHLNPAK
jgi:hypothetical protein